MYDILEWAIAELLSCQHMVGVWWKWLFCCSHSNYLLYLDFSHFTIALYKFV